MENNWDFDCTLKINPELLTAYNETNHADFELLPDNCYTLAEKVSFVSGKVQVSLRLKLIFRMI